MVRSTLNGLLLPRWVPKRLGNCLFCLIGATVSVGIPLHRFCHPYIFVLHVDFVIDRFRPRLYWNRFVFLEEQNLRGSLLVICLVSVSFNLRGTLDRWVQLLPTTLYFGDFFSSFFFLYIIWFDWDLWYTIVAKSLFGN